MKDEEIKKVQDMNECMATMRIHKLEEENIRLKLKLEDAEIKYYSDQSKKQIIEYHEAMKEGMQDRIYDIEKENKRLKSQLEQLYKASQDLSIIMRACKASNWKSNKKRFKVLGHDISSFVKGLNAQLKAGNKIVEENKVYIDHTAVQEIINKEVYRIIESDIFSNHFTGVRTGRCNNKFRYIGVMRVPQKGDHYEENGIVKICGRRTNTSARNIVYRINVDKSHKSMHKDIMIGRCCRCLIDGCR